MYEYLLTPRFLSPATLFLSYYGYNLIFLNTFFSPRSSPAGHRSVNNTFPVACAYWAFISLGKVAIYPGGYFVFFAYGAPFLGAYLARREIFSNEDEVYLVMECLILMCLDILRVYNVMNEANPHDLGHLHITWVFSFALGFLRAFLKVSFMYMRIMSCFTYVSSPRENKDSYFPDYSQWGPVQTFLTWLLLVRYVCDSFFDDIYVTLCFLFPSAFIYGWGSSPSGSDPIAQDGFLEAEELSEDSEEK